MAYTAEQVRLAILDAKSAEMDNEDWPLIYALLTDYADRLEQDEQRVTDKESGISMRFVKEFDITTDKIPTSMLLYGPFPAEHWEAVREEGRREVYREILTISPLAEMGGNLYCVFCGSDAHAPDCLLERATAALRETTPTP